jgi:hypothetical protein
MFKKTKQRQKQKQKQKQKQAQVVNINIGRDKESEGKSNTPPRAQPPMGYVSYSPPLHQMNRLIPSAQIQPYGQKTLHQLGVNRNEQGTQAGVAVPTWWNNPQQNEYGRPINLLDNLASVSNKSVNSVSIQDDIDDIVQSERSLEIQHSYPSSASYASSSPASLASYPTDVINGNQQGDEAVSAQAASSGAEEIKEEAVPAESAAQADNDVNEYFIDRQKDIARRIQENLLEQKEQALPRRKFSKELEAAIKRKGRTKTKL